MSTKEIQEYQNSISLLNLIADMPSICLRSDNLPLEKIDVVIQKIAMCLAFPGMGWEKLREPLLKLENRVFDYRQRVLLNEKYLELKINSNEFFPVSLKEQLESLLPLQLSQLSSIKKKIEDMLANSDWAPSHRHLILVKRRVEDLERKQNANEKFDSEIEQIGLTNLIKTILHPPRTILREVRNFLFVPQLWKAIDEHDVKAVREEIIRNPECVFSQCPITMTRVDQVNWSVYDAFSYLCHTQKADHHERERLEIFNLFIRAGADVNSSMLAYSYQNFSRGWNANTVWWSKPPLALAMNCQFREECEHGEFVSPDTPLPPNVRMHEIMLKMLFEAGAEINWTNEVPFMLNLEIGAVGRADPREYHCHRYLSHLMKVGMNINVIRLNLTTLELETPLSHLWSSRVESHRYQRQCQLDGRQCQLALSAWYLFEGAIVHEEALDKASPEIIKHFGVCQDIMKTCYSRAHVLGMNMLGHFKGTTPLVNIVLEYFSAKQECHEMESKIFKINQEIERMASQTKMAAHAKMLTDQVKSMLDEGYSKLACSASYSSRSFVMERNDTLSSSTNGLKRKFPITSDRPDGATKAKFDKDKGST